VAREIVAQTNSDGADFRELAARHAADETTREAGGYIGWVRRRDLDPEIATRVFAGTPKRCVPPIRLPDGSFLVVLLHEQKAAVLDAATEEELRDLLLARWLGHLR
jgi:parvulin-like peptidyl-prolyl isomerase